MAAEQQQERKVGIGLGIGIFIAPLIFSWFTLREGHTKKSRVIAFFWLVFSLLLAIGLSAEDDGFASTTPSSAIASDSKKHTTPKKNRSQTKKTFQVGDLRYTVWEAWYTDTLSADQFLNTPPDSTYLFIKLTVENASNRPMVIPSFNLVDTIGDEYETTDKAFGIDNNLDYASALNPNVSKQGIIIFDVPKRNDYKLEVFAGEYSFNSAFIDIEL